MKIALLCLSSSWGGLEINTYKLAAWLQKDACDVLLVAPPKSKLLEEGMALGVECLSLHKKSKYTDFSALKVLAHQLQVFQPDCLINMISKDITFSVMVRKRSGHLFPVVYQQHMNIGISKRGPLHTYFYKKLSGWISPLPAITQTTLKMTKVSERQIFEIPFCIDVEDFPVFTERRDQARTAFGLGMDDFVVGIVGRLDPHKNQATVIKAIKILKDEGVVVKGLIVGDETLHEQNNYKQTLQDLAASLDVEDQLIFYPHIKETSLAFSAMDVSVTATFNETFGMVTLEAMASGIPVIGANTGGTKDLVIDQETGLHFDPNDPVSLAEGITFLTVYPKKRIEMGVNARNRVLNQFDKTRMLKELKEMVGILSS